MLFVVCSGEDLKDLAVDHSICPSKDEGGVLGWVRKGQMVYMPFRFNQTLFLRFLNLFMICYFFIFCFYIDGLSWYASLSCVNENYIWLYLDKQLIYAFVQYDSVE
jgi:hypothetical protein